MSPPLTEAAHRREQARINRERREERRRYLHKRVRELHAQGMPSTAIARLLRVGRDTVGLTLAALGLKANGHGHSLPEGLP